MDLNPCMIGSSPDFDLFALFTSMREEADRTNTANFEERVEAACRRRWSVLPSAMRTRLSSEGQDSSCFEQDERRRLNFQEGAGRQLLARLRSQGEPRNEEDARRIWDAFVDEARRTQAFGITGCNTALQAVGSGLTNWFNPADTRSLILLALAIAGQSPEPLDPGLREQVCGLVGHLIDNLSRALAVLKLSAPPEFQQLRECLHCRETIHED